MFLFSLLRPVQSWLLTTKRLLFRESAEVIQYYRGAVESLQEQFQQLSRRPQIAKSQVEELFKVKKDLITERFNHFASFHDNDPPTQQKVHQYRAEIVSKLQTLETNVMADLNALFNSRTSEIYLSRHGDRYRQILQAHQLLTGQTPTNPRTTSTPRSMPRQVPNPPEPTPPQVEIPETPPSTEVPVAGLFRNIPRRGNTLPFSQERREANLAYLDLSKNWNDIDERFRGSFLDHIGNTPGNIAFLSRAVQHPQQLRELVKSLYDQFKVLYPNTSYSTYPSFFENLGRVDLRGTSVQEAHDKLMEQFRKDVIREDWDEEVSANERIPQSPQIRTLLNGLELSLTRRELPTRETFLNLQRITRYVERVLLENHPLNWQQIREARITPGVSTSLSTSPVGAPQHSLTPSVYHIQGRSDVQLRRVSMINPPYSKTMTVVRNTPIDFDLPRFIESLKLLSREYSPLIPGSFEDTATVDFSQLTVMSPETIEQIDLQRHSEMLQSLGIRDTSFYESQFPLALAQLLDHQNPSEKKSAQQWIDQINARQGTPQMSQGSGDAYKFLWLVRFYARTRQIQSAQEMTLDQFASELLKAKEYPDRFNAPAGTTETLIPNLSPNQVELLVHEYNEYRNIPAIRNIFDFLSTHNVFVRAMNISGRPLPINEKRLVIIPWNEAVRLLQDGEQAAMSSPSGMVFSSDTSNGAHPHLFFNRESIQAFSHLKNTNPLFREIVAMGESMERATAVPITGNLTLKDLVLRLLTPNSTTNPDL